MERELLGYHGSDEKYVVSMKKDNFKMRVSKSSFPNDLGIGAYFYLERGEGEALENVRKYLKKYKKNYETLVGLEVPIVVDEELILDFNIRESSEIFEEFIRKNRENIDKELNKYHEKSRGFLRGNFDGIAMELFLEFLGVDADLIIKDTFTKFDDEYKRSNFHNGREVCVRNPKIIQLSKIRIAERIERDEEKEKLKCL